MGGLPHLLPLSLSPSSISIASDSQSFGCLLPALKTDKAESCGGAGEIGGGRGVGDEVVAGESLQAARVLPQHTSFIKADDESRDSLREDKPASKHAGRGKRGHIGHFGCEAGQEPASRCG